MHMSENTTNLGGLVTREEAEQIARDVAEKAIRARLAPPMYFINPHERLVTYDMFDDLSRDVQSACRLALNGVETVQGLWLVRFALWWNEYSFVIAILAIVFGVGVLVGMGVTP